MKRSDLNTMVRSLFVPSIDESRKYEKLIVKHYFAKVLIDNQIATTDVEILLNNPNEYAIEGDFIFPLSDSADTVNVNCQVNSHQVEPDLLGKNRLKKFYNSILDSEEYQDLHEIGTSALQLENLSINARAECKIQIQYNEFIEEVDEEFVYTHHLRSNQPVGRLELTLAVEGTNTIESPSHKVSVNREDENRVQIIYQENDVLLDENFVCKYSLINHEMMDLKLLHSKESLALSRAKSSVPSNIRYDAVPVSKRMQPNMEDGLSQPTRLHRGAQRLGEVQLLRRNLSWGFGLNTINDAAYHDVFFKGHGVNPFIDTEDDNLSTFGMDADTASYSVMRRYLNDGYLPPPEAVRVEEFVNTFNYGYTPPIDSAFAVHLEGAPSKYGSGKRLQLLRIGIQGHVIPDTDRKDAVLTFVIDVSGSMGIENRLGHVKKALRLLVEQLRPTDKIGIVVYGTNARVVLPHTSNVNHQQILEKIDALCPEGVTNVEDGIRKGYDLASKNAQKECINRVILCSDGVANEGVTSPEQLLKEINDYVEDEGIYLTTVGFGMGNYNDVLMEELAKKGNGNYAYVDTLKEAKRIFVENLTGTLQVIAKDAKIQVKFNEDTVSRFRLLGYENRRMEHEDFRNDDADAGEIGSGHSVTALYEIKLHKDVNKGKLATVYIRHEDPDTAEVTEVKQKIRVEELKPKYEDSSPSFQFATSVAQFAEILRDSYWAKDGSLADVQRTIKGVLPKLDSDSPQSEEQTEELFNLVRKARKLKDANEVKKK